MPTHEQDREFLRSGVQDLENYLLSGELFGGVSRPLPMLTLGSLLLTRRRVEAREPQPALSGAIESLRSKWRVAWETRASDEFRARVRLWRNYLRDYAEDPDLESGAFATEVRHRAILRLLLDELPAAQPDSQTLRSLDQTLEAILLPGEFVWDRELAPAFPQTEFWFLYGRLKS